MKKQTFPTPPKQSSSFHHLRIPLTVLLEDLRDRVIARGERVKWSVEAVEAPSRALGLIWHMRRVIVCASRLDLKAG